MLISFFIVAMVNQLWYALPLVVVVSLVYSATRHELMRPILEHAARLALSIVVFMAIILALLSACNWLVGR
jgi:hypothetical protein